MSTSFSKQKWAVDFLAQIGNSHPDPLTIGFVWGWTQMESGAQDSCGADYNPLNTTQKMPGSTPLPGNSAGVQMFVSYDQGLQANAMVLKNGLYPTLLAALAQNNDTALAGPDVAGDLSVWVSGRRSPVDTSYVSGILSLMREHAGSIPMAGLVLNSKGMIANFIPVSQFEAGETEFACGFFAGATVRSAVPPNSPFRKDETAETVDQWADHQYALVYGSFGSNMTGGISIDELHTVFHNAGNLHYWDLPISPTSSQSSDLANIKRALQAGYPVVATIVEASVRDVTGDIPAGNPYEWNPVCNTNSCPTHVIVYCGIDKNGNLLAVDYANVVGPLQGNNSVRAWPRHYDIATIDNTFATVVQLVGDDPSKPWLKPIPDPANAAAWNGFNAQNTENWPAAPAPTPDYQRQQAQDRWNSTAAFFGGQPANDQTGIAKAWFEDFMAGKVHGPPLTAEYDSVRWGSGTPIKIQEFVGGHYEWNIGNGAHDWHANA